MFLVPLVVFLGVKFGFRKSCQCKRNDKYEVCIKGIKGVSWAYISHNFGKIWAYYGHFFGLIWAQILDILGISVVYLGHLLGISLA